MSENVYQIDFNKPESVHFIGIGGISMSGLAEILMDEGFTVSGSDSHRSELTDNLEARGARVYIGQKAENIQDGIDVVVYTAAIHPDNPEFQEVKRRGIPMLTRAELLGEMMRNYKNAIAIAGTHGKTTTTSMVTEIFLQAKNDPTISVGGILPAIGGNIRVGGPEFFVTEACEYTNSFLSFYPTMAVILNIEEDHLDFFKDLADIRHSFKLFAERVPAQGAIVINGDIENYQEIIEAAKGKVITFGHSRGNDYSAGDIQYDDYAHPSFDLYIGGEKKERLTLGVAGEHNVYNALAAVSVARELGLTCDEMKRGIESVQTIGGRSNLIHKNGITIIDDCYNANPVSMKASIDVLSNAPGRKIAVLGDMGELGAEEKQLHYMVGEHFAGKGIDALYCVGTLSQEIAKAVRTCSSKTEVHHYEDKADLIKDLVKEVQSGDTVLVKASHFMGFQEIVKELTK